MDEKQNNQEIINALKEIIGNGITGKLERISKTLDGHIENHKTWQIEDREWKAKMEPILDSIPELSSIGEGMKAVNTFGRGAKWIAGVAIAVGAIWAFIKFVIMAAIK